MPGDGLAALRMDGHLNRWYLDPVLHGECPAGAWRTPIGSRQASARTRLGA
jgi:hypothetical protein